MTKRDRTLSLLLTTMLTMPAIHIRIKQDELTKLLELKDGRSWLTILRLGLGMKAPFPSRKEVQAMIDESIERAKHGGY